MHQYGLYYLFLPTHTINLGTNQTIRSIANLYITLDTVIKIKHHKFYKLNINIRLYNQTFQKSHINTRSLIHSLHSTDITMEKLSGDLEYPYDLVIFINYKGAIISG